MRDRSDDPPHHKLMSCPRATSRSSLVTVSGLIKPCVTTLTAFWHLTAADSNNSCTQVIKQAFCCQCPFRTLPPVSEVGEAVTAAAWPSHCCGGGWEARWLTVSSVLCGDQGHGPQQVLTTYSWISTTFKTTDMTTTDTWDVWGGGKIGGWATLI